MSNFETSVAIFLKKKISVAKLCLPLYKVNWDLGLPRHYTPGTTQKFIVSFIPIFSYLLTLCCFTFFPNFFQKLQFLLQCLFIWVHCWSTVFNGFSPLIEAKKFTAFITGFLESIGDFQSLVKFWTCIWYFPSFLISYLLSSFL